MKPKNDHCVPDRELTARILNGERDAFVLLIRQTEGLVAKMVFQMIGVSGDRKDLVQEIYLNAFKYLPAFRHESKLSTWIGQIAYHTCLHYIKEKKLVYLEDLPETDMYTDENDNGKLPRELTGILQDAVARLPPLYRTLVTLFHQEEMSYEEIQEITDLPEGTVKNYLFRARRALRADLLKRYNKEDL
ncbi:MAG TPA: RNA polymerase sigma factor [Mucilaginibacter sp.]|nr:RNA polymerase sigma factor [Mucilaginibacter sp.]